MALVLALLVAGALRAFHVGFALSAIGAWDAGGLTWLALVLLTAGRADADVTRMRAGAEDIGRRTAYFGVVLGSLASLVAATVLSRHPRSIASEEERTAFVCLCFAAVALAWALMHTTFTLRYAHLYYRDDDDGIGGVEFAGKAPPDYADFAYLAFTIGMCFQVSDMTVTSRLIRRTLLGHALLSFAFNTILLAFVLNLVFGAID